MADIKIAWGKNVNGELTHVKSLPKGIGRSCGLVCPDCNNPLEARQGNVKRWHFAHAVTTDCKGETVLHKVAKKALVQAAQSFKKFRLPARVVVQEELDELNQKHPAAGVFAERLSVLSGAREEVRLSTGQVADVVISTEALYPRQLVVEVFVSHRKSELDIERFQSMAQDAVEIDLSDLQWDASFEEIESAVLDTAWRYWLHSTLDDALLAESRQGAKIKAAEANQRNAVTLELRLSELANMSPSDKVLRWPSLYAQAEGRDSAGKVHFKNASVTLIVDAFPASWSLRDGLWWSTTTVNKIPIDVVAVMAEQEHWLQLVQPKLTKPTLVAFLPVLREIGEYYIDHFKWLGTEKWQAKLENQVASALQCKINEADRLNSNIDSFVHRFIGMDIGQRLGLLNTKFEIPPPTTPGWYDRAWNAPTGLWKRLVWHYCIKSAQSDVSTEWIASSVWLKRLLEFSDDDAAMQQRRKAAWFFLKKFEARGLIQHVINQHFVVLTRLKDIGWQPWMDER